MTSLTHTEAFERGYTNGFSAGRDCEALSGVFSVESMQGEAHDAEQNARSFSPWEYTAAAINSVEDEDESDYLWETYDHGVAAGIHVATKARYEALIGEKTFEGCLSTDMFESGDLKAKIGYHDKEGYYIILFTLDGAFTQACLLSSGIPPSIESQEDKDPSKLRPVDSDDSLSGALNAALSFSEDEGTDGGFRDYGTYADQPRFGDSVTLVWTKVSDNDEPEDD